MEVSSPDPSPTAMDLSKGFSVNSLTCGHLAMKPEWYRRNPPSTDANSPYSTRSRTASSSYSSMSTGILDSSMEDDDAVHLHPEMDGVAHLRDMEHDPERIRSYMNSSLAQGLGLYHGGAHNNQWHTGFYGSNPTQVPIPESSGGEESDSGSDVIFLVSTAKDSLPCSSVSRESVSPVVETLSPAAFSLDEGRSCFILPQTLSSPSRDSTYSDESSDSSVDIPVHHARPVVLLSDLSAVYGNPVESPIDISTDDSDVVEVPVTDKRNKSNDLSDKTFRRKSLEDKTQVQKKGESLVRGVELRRSARVRRFTSETHHLPNSVSQYNLRRQIRNSSVGLYSECYDSGAVMESTERLSSSEEESLSHPDLARRVSGNLDASDMDTPTAGKRPSTSPPRESASVWSRSKAKSLTRKQKRLAAARKSKKMITKQQRRQRMAEERISKVSAGVKAGAGRKNPSKKRRRKKYTRTGLPTLFPPGEPEIQLKFTKVKGGKKRDKLDGFRPFVRIARRVCTVVNYEEEEASVRRGGGHHPARALSVAGFVPTTSCFRLGRLGSESKCPSTQVCCLCGQTANAMGLGDLHGPYLPVGRSLDWQSRQQSLAALFARDRKSSKKERGRSHELNNSHVLRTEDEWSDGDGSISASIGRSPAVDRHSPPAAPAYTGEWWIHEDCGIWSAGIFLVKGKLYGLGEAALLAQETNKQFRGADGQSQR
ncbi:uncharacterized protein LOC130118962 isoform X2 [Lampris incognitus]|uniref:uncharacterized protein LOC130118962 isoform X2 n=1 Tax=Lampris incognitus TaxID=2546036 RepID=UPI0024B5FA6F|nr:uncharacterized protein LOC130118962 isoform X2 [Lampris incognitus]